MDVDQALASHMLMSPVTAASDMTSQCEWSAYVIWHLLFPLWWTELHSHLQLFHLSRWTSLNWWAFWGPVAFWLSPMPLASFCLQKVRVMPHSRQNFCCMTYFWPLAPSPHQCLLCPVSVSDGASQHPGDHSSPPCCTWRSSSHQLVFTLY